MKFDAAIQGIDLDKDKKKKENNSLGMMFPHPEDISDLTEKQRNDNAEKQIRFHKSTLPNQMGLGA